MTVVDTETTGLDIKEGERIRSIAYAQGTLDGGLRAKGSFVLDTEGRLSGPEAFRVHRIGNDDPRQIPAREGLLAMMAVVADGGEPGTGVAVMHNAEFDLAFIGDALERAGLPPHRWEVQDTMRMSLERNPTRHANLDALAKEHGLDGALLRRRKERHDAEEDCELTFELWRRIVRPLVLDLAPGSGGRSRAGRGEARGTGTDEPGATGARGATERRTPELDW